MILERGLKHYPLPLLLLGFLNLRERSLILERGLKFRQALVRVFDKDFSPEPHNPREGIATNSSVYISFRVIIDGEGPNPRKGIDAIANQVYT